MKKSMKKLITAIIMTCMLVTMIAPMAVMAAEETGTITINSDDVVLTGKTINAYQVLTLSTVKDGAGNVTGYVYTVADAWKNFFTGKLSVDANRNTFDVDAVNAINTYITSNGIEKLAELLQEYAEDNNNNISETKAATINDAETAIIENLPLGYYLILDETVASNSTVISAVMLESVDGDVAIDLKADQPTIEKNIWEDSAEEGIQGERDADELVDSNTALVGEVVNYVLTSKVPDVTGYDKYDYTITDTFSDGLTFGEDVAVKIGDYTLVDGDYTYSYFAATNEADAYFTYYIDMRALVDAGKIAVGEDVIVTYTATVNENAIVGNTGNSNSVNLEYSNDPDNSESKAKTPDDTVITYLTEIKIAKVDSSSNPLTGAEFTIEGEGIKYVVSTIQDEDGNVTVHVDSPAIQNTTTTGTVDENGYLIFRGLGEGTYIITETKAPDGYTGLDGTIDVTIDCTLPNTVSNTTDECSWSYSYVVKDGEGKTLTTSDVTEENTGTYTIKVVNKAGSELPSTGGIGTTIFIVVGVALMGTAVVLFAIKKKASAK